MDERPRFFFFLLYETRPGPCPVAPVDDRHRSGPCRSPAGSSPVAAAICPACSDSVPALREPSPRRRRPCRARRAAAKRCLDTARTPPVDNNNNMYKNRIQLPKRETPSNLLGPPPVPQPKTPFIPQEATNKNKVLKMTNWWKGGWLFF